MRRARGFTLIEVLVAAAIFAVVVGLATRPVQEMIASFVRIRRESEAMSQNLAFLEMLGRDIRMSSRVIEISERRVVLGGDGEEITWEASEGAVMRRVGDRVATLPARIDGLTFAGREAAPKTRHILVRGNFAGIGQLERGYGLRNDAR